jgi:ferrous iron transport protein B
MITSVSTLANPRTLKIALAGNPNAGKSTLFNALTGIRQHVGNWPGKTVEKKSGLYWSTDFQLEIIDLPGTYSLSAFSLEEVVARNYIIDERPDVIVAVVDAANLERNLYLVGQLLELATPVVVALNMMDVATRQGLSFDVDGLEAALGVPVILITARKSEGFDELIEAIVSQAASSSRNFRLDYGPEIESEIEYLLDLPDLSGGGYAEYPARWLAIKLLEDDADLATKISEMPDGDLILSSAAWVRVRLNARLGEDVETLIAERRYEWIHELVVRNVKKSWEDGTSQSDRIDRVATHPRLGIPFFLLAMGIVFKITTDLSAVWVDWLGGVIEGPLSRWLTSFLEAIGLGGTWIVSLAVDGVLAGVGAVMAFIPVLLALYMALAVLEDSGYMARGAFVMDRLMNCIGLHGRSFLPLMVGFGCSVPAIYATRTLTNRRDRILTGLLVPFMSCGARLPVYVLFATIFFPDRAGLVILMLYVLGMVVALGVGLILQRTILPQTTVTGLVMELPPYRLPNLRSIWYQMWLRTRSFLQHAASLILITSLVIWFLAAIPTSSENSFAATPIEESVFGRLSGAVAPVFRPLGFGSWEASGALLSGLVAKEVVVSTLAQSFAPDREAATDYAPTTFLDDVGEIVTSFWTAVVDTLRAIPSIVGLDLVSDEAEGPTPGLTTAIRAGFEASSGGHAALAGLAFLVFVLIYTPCMAALAAERQELGARWMWLSLVSQFGLAWILAFLVFQGGLLFGVG